MNLDFGACGGNGRGVAGRQGSDQLCGVAAHVAHLADKGLDVVPEQTVGLSGRLPHRGQGVGGGGKAAQLLEQGLSVAPAGGVGLVGADAVGQAGGLVVSADVGHQAEGLGPAGAEDGAQRSHP